MLLKEPVSAAAGIDVNNSIFGSGACRGSYLWVAALIVPAGLDWARSPLVAPPPLFCLLNLL